MKRHCFHLILLTVFLGCGQSEEPMVPPSAPPAPSIKAPSDLATSPVAAPTSPADPAGPGPREVSSTAPPRPAALLQLPPQTPNAILVDLSKNEIFLLDREDEGPIGPASYVSYGKQGLFKEVEGDEKTPVGVYFLTSYIPGEKLPAIYGVGALPMDYPNPWDLHRGRTGSGIWIHGTDKTDDALLPQSSRGCLTLRNQDFEALKPQVTLAGTPVIVSDQLEWVPPEELEDRRKELAATIEVWRKDWESRDPETYLTHYSEEFRTGSMGYGAFARHKRRVNTSKKFIEVEVEDLGLYAYPGEQGLALATFRQTYRSDNFENQAQKQQYWKHDGERWRIVLEASSR